MHQQARNREHEFFITSDLRPSLLPDLDQNPPIMPQVSAQVLHDRALTYLSERSASASLMGIGLSEKDWDRTYARVPDVVGTAANPEIILLNLDNGMYYNLNRAGSFVWSHLTGDLSVREIHRLLCKQYVVEERIARDDLAAFMRQLHEAGLVMSEEPRPGDNDTAAAGATSHTGDAGGTDASENYSEPLLQTLSPLLELTHKSGQEKSGELKEKLDKESTDTKNQSDKSSKDNKDGKDTKEGMQ